MASITGATLKDQIERAISAHGVFKFKLSHMVEAGTAEMSPTTVGADDQCPMGEWLYSTLDPSVRATAQYVKVRDLHARFHHAAGEVATLAAARRRTEALEAMELTSTFKRTSDQLVEALETWAEMVAAEQPQPTAAAATFEPERPAEVERPAAVEEPAEATGAQREDELPPGWWLDSPATIEIEAEVLHEEELAQERVREQGQEPEEEQAKPADTADVEGLTDINDWFGLPRGTSQLEPPAEKKPAEEEAGGEAEGAAEGAAEGEEEAQRPAEDAQDE